MLADTLDVSRWSSTRECHERYEDESIAQALGHRGRIMLDRTGPFAPSRHERPSAIGFWNVLRSTTGLMLASTACSAILAVSAPSNVQATLRTGTVQLFQGDGVDFSDPTGEDFSDFVYDVTAVGTAAQHDAGRIELFTCIPPALILYVGDTEQLYDSLTTAPTNHSTYKSQEFANIDEVFVVLTREGHYAKIRVISIAALLTIEYTYQDDGTNVLSSSVSVHETTWGGVKAVFRQRE
jgi:hypothetical protein